MNTYTVLFYAFLGMTLISSGAIAGLLAGARIHYGAWKPVVADILSVFHN